MLFAWTVVPWAGLAWLGGVIAWRRWAGLPLGVSLGGTAAAAFLGWRFLWQWGHRQYDLELASLLQGVPALKPWESLKHPVLVIEAAHLARCQQRWGVNARSSGWGRLRRLGRMDLTGVPLCMLLTVHPWWLG